jgi:hypothetical protein
MDARILRWRSVIVTGGVSLVPGCQACVNSNLYGVRVCCYHMISASAAHAKQRLQPMRQNDVPASLFGEERHCSGRMEMLVSGGFW